MSASAASNRVSPRTAAAKSWPVFSLLLSLRIVNALVVKTFFQPDEYFQSLEPAWRLAFGIDSGAWITWEWRNHLRSSLHPLLLALIYRGASALSRLFSLSPEIRAELLLASPKVAQAVFASCIDYYTWSCAQRLCGPQSRAAWTTLLLSITSPWQFFCSVRTLSNSVETALTAAALFYWPWHSISEQAWSHAEAEKKLQPKRSKSSIRPKFGPVMELRVSLLLAAFGTILRPTNILIWIPVGLRALWQSPSLWRRLIAESLNCGSLVLLVSVLADRWFYDAWTFPPYRFLHFNITQSLAVFYGKNRWDYYLTEGIPLLLTTSLPFAVVGIYQQTFQSSTKRKGTSLNNVESAALRTLAWMIVFVAFCLSLISHKEVRFLYPTLPALHLISAIPLSKFIKFPTRAKRLILVCLLSTNVVIGIYLTQVHQRGALDVLHYLRSQHESHLRLQIGETSRNMTVGFLMPCHSTPWRSHLIYPSIDAWALTCEPPLDVPLDQRGSYMDEADLFYADPSGWLKAYMQESQRIAQGSITHAAQDDLHASTGLLTPHQPGSGVKVPTVKQRIWPHYLVFFEQLEPVLKSVVTDGRYNECRRFFNTHFHDDGRRKGDVVVWCMG